MNILFLIILIIISFFPILIWAYSFAYIDQNPLNKKRFLVWVLGWILSVFPILYMWKIVEFFDSKYLNVFYFAYKIRDFFSSLEFGFSLSLFILFIVFLSFIFWFFLSRKKEIFKIYAKNFLIFLIFILLFSVLVFGLNFFLDAIDFSVKNPVSFGNIIFDSLKLLIFYYLVVAFVEESSKHFNFLQSSIFSLNSVKSWVENAIFVALWFAFIENILYLYNFYNSYWLNFELVKIYFFRSIFSVIVHVLCSSVLAYYFSRAYLIHKEKNLNFPYFKIFFTGFFISIFLHLFFDLSMSFGISLVLFAYFIGWYLYVSSIFYRE